MKHNFHERKANRIDHAKKQAKKNEELSDSLFEKASKMASIVPMGQPILVTPQRKIRPELPKQDPQHIWQSI